MVFSPGAIAAETAVPPDLVILYTGDGQGNIEPTGCCSKIGGLARRATKIKEFKEKYTPLILVDTGDFLWKNPRDTVHPIRVEHIHNAFMAIGYDAINIADGEIASGDEFIKHFGNNAAMPLVSSNVVASKEGGRTWPPYIIKKTGKLKTAVIGLASPDLVKNNPDGIFTVSDPVKTLEKYLPEIKAKADIIILLSHLGWDPSRQMAQTYPDIDIVIVAHDTYPTFDPERIGKTLLVKNSWGGGLLGVIDVWADPSNRAEKIESRLEVLVTEIQPLPEYAKFETDFKKDAVEYKRKLKERETAEKAEQVIEKYKKMTPQQFLEQMKKENRVMTQEDLKKEESLASPE
jgi:2',3'-cyclic-nucleotide 2'-phosphodiesterase (5'-nucleotidase family)